MTQSTGDMTGKPLWEIVSVGDAFGPASFGGSNRLKRVTFKVNVDDSESYVDVPYGPGWPEKAQAEIEQMVTDHLAALQLQGPVIV